MFRKYIILFLAAFQVVCGFAQSKSVVVNDITDTMNDFIGDLNNLTEDEESVPVRINSMTKTFGSSEYFIFNGKQMDSMKDWLQQYYNEYMVGMDTQHQLAIKQQTLEKMVPTNEDDKRYRFTAVLTREAINATPQQEEINFVVCWKGEGEYVSILEAHGNWGFDIVEISKVGSKHWAYDIQEWMKFPLLGLAVLIFILYGLTSFKPGILFPIAMLSLLGFFILEGEQANVDSIKNANKKLAKYNIENRVDSLYVAWVKKDGLIGLTDYTGNLILDYQFDRVGLFHDGLAWVVLNEHIAFVNGDGEVALPPVYTYGHNFREGITLVGDKSGYYVINTEGEKLREVRLNAFPAFREGITVFRHEGLYGYLTEWDYNEIVPPTYTKAEHFEKGRAIVTKGNKSGVIDINGKEIISVSYDSVTRNSKYFKVVKHGLHGVMDADGKLLIPYIYDKINIVEEGKALVYRNGKSSILNF